MPGKTPNNGKKPLENGIQKKKDVEMTDSSKAKGKKAAKDGDEEMTVVVPPSKSSKKSAQAPADAEGDVAMEEDEEETKVDPVVQTVAGEQHSRWTLYVKQQLLTSTPLRRYQEQLCPDRSRRCPF